MLSTQDPLSQQKKPFLLWRPFIAFWHWMFPPTLADLDRQTRTSRIVGGLLIVSVSVGVVVFVLLNARKWHVMYKNSRANSLVEEAKAFESAEKYVEAIKSANEAYMLDPENPNAIRSIARYATMMKRNEARFLWNKLRDAGEMTPQDAVWEARALANLSEDKMAAESIERLAREAPPSRELVEAADQILSKAGHKKELLDILAAYSDANPDDTETRLVYAIRRIQYGDTFEKRQATEVLWELAASQEKVGLKAIEFLDKTLVNTTGDTERLIQLLEKHPLAEEEHRVAALRRLADLHPDRKKQIIQDAMKSRSHLKREQLVPLARWITIESQSEPAYAEQLVEFLREDQVIDYIPLLENYLNALTILKHYEALERLIKDPRARLTPAQKGFYLMHLAYITGAKAEDLDSKMVDALMGAESERRGDMVMKIAQYAEARNHLLVAEQAYRSGTSHRQIEREAFDGLLRLTYRNGNSRGFMEASNETARRWPENQLFLERFTYASLLSGIEMEGAIEQARRLLEAQPDDSQRKLIMALACARQMDPQRATKYLDRIKLDDLSPGQGAVLCGIMKAAGIAGQASRISAQIPEGTPMLPEEERFLQLAKQ